jgi:hypothetical protein
VKMSEVNIDEETPGEEVEAGNEEILPPVG